MSIHVITSIIQDIYLKTCTDKNNLTDEEKRIKGNKNASHVCLTWQDACLKLNLDIDKEVRVAGHSKIDLVDKTNGVAYELKYSSNNPGHEFYKDLFKVLAYKKLHGVQINTLVFISDAKGIKSLDNTKIATEAIQFMKANGIEVKLVGLQSKPNKVKAAA